MVDEKEFTVLTINIGVQTKPYGEDVRKAEKKKGKGAISNARRKIFMDKIRIEDPDIICLQEQIYKDVDEIVSMMDKLNEGDFNNRYYLVKQSQGHSAILVKKEKFESSLKDEIDDKDTDLVSDVRARLTLVKVKPKDFPRALLVGSWHGSHTGKDLKSKRSTAENLVKILEGKGMAYFIGGDFNLKKSEFPNSGAVSAAKSSDIDYFLCGGYGIYVEEVKKSVYDDEKRALAFLDHVPIEGTLIIEAPRMSKISVN